MINIHSPGVNYSGSTSSIYQPEAGNGTTERGVAGDFLSTLGLIFVSRSNPSGLAIGNPFSYTLRIRKGVLSEQVSRDPVRFESSIRNDLFGIEVAACEQRKKLVLANTLP
jgi:hypothetical protein